MRKSSKYGWVANIAIGYVIITAINNFNLACNYILVLIKKYNKYIITNISYRLIAHLG